MSRFRPGTWLILALGLTIPAGLLEAQEGGDPSKPDATQLFQPKSVEDLRQGLAMLRRTVWSTQDLPMARVADAQGRSFAADMTNIVLSAKANVAIEAAIATAAETLAKNPKADVKATLQPATTLVLEEFSRAFLLANYWAVVNSQRVHLAYLEPLLANADESQRVEALGKLSAINVDSLERIRTLAGRPEAPESQDLMAAVGPWGQMFETYNSVRGQLAEKQSSAAAARGEKGRTRAREAECPPSVSPLSANARVSIRKRANVDAFYPPDFRGHHVEGVAKVAITTSPTGCVTEVRVVTSSGAPELDDAALRVALEMEFNPGSEDGKAIATEATMPVNFRLRDRPTPNVP